MNNTKTIYADYSATTPVRQEVIDAMLPLYKEDFGNPSSIHSYGIKAQKYLETARNNIAAVLNAKSNEIYFTSGGTEANNTVINGIEILVEENLIKKKKHIITTKIEHSSVIAQVERLQKKGWQITWLNVDKEGFISLEELKSNISDQTALVSIIHANNEIGTIQDLKNISLVCKSHNVLLHADAVQSFCKVPVDVNELTVDFLTISGHKIYGPKGVGALYIKSSQKLPPLIIGGGQEANLRSGTENISGIVGLGIAAKLLNSEIHQIASKLRQQQIRLMEKISSSEDKKFIFTGVEINKIKENIPNEKFLYRIPGHISLCIKDTEAESIVLQCDLCGIAISAGSACSNLDLKTGESTLKPSHVITALNIPKEYEKGSIRITLGKDTTNEEVDYIAESLINIINKLSAKKTVLK